MHFVVDAHENLFIFFDIKYLFSLENRERKEKVNKQSLAGCARKDNERDFGFRSWEFSLLVSLQVQLPQNNCSGSSGTQINAFFFLSAAAAVFLFNTSAIL